MDKPLVISSSPHLHCGMNTRGIMLDVIIALVPALGVSTWLSYLLGVPYWVMAGSLLVGQAICGVAGGTSGEGAQARLAERETIRRQYRERKNQGGNRGTVPAGK